MKKAILTSSLILCLITLVQAQSLNTEMDSETESPFLLGEINKKGLTSENYNQWFSENHDSYELDESIIKEISNPLKGHTILAFMGTWCGDSKLEVPRFYKVLEACNYPINQLKFIAVSRKADMYKQSPNHEEKGLNIHRVPTFIFYKDGKEVNRIVEHPVETFEKDIFNIVTSNTYESNYQIVTHVNTILENDGLKGLKKSSKLILKTFKGNVPNMYALNTYARILHGTNRVDEAIAVFELNLKLFPDMPNTYMSLANTLALSGEKKKAIVVLEKAIKLFPDDKDLSENLLIIKTN